MSQHRTIETNERGSIEALSSCAGTFYDIYDSQGKYQGSALSLAEAQAILNGEGIYSGPVEVVGVERWGAEAQ